jgi:Protein of unknown function (DUF3106)
MRLGIAALVVLSGLFPWPTLASPPLRLAQGWRDLSPRQRYEALQNYRRHEHLPEQRRENVERNYERWRAMPPQERERIRKKYEAFQHLAPEERERLKRHYRDTPEH